MAGPVGVVAGFEAWLIGHWGQWPSYLRAGVWAVAGALLAHWYW